MLPEDLTWLAGFLEGEGSFGSYSNGKRLCIQAGQVQKWPLEKTQSVAGGGKVRGPYDQNQTGMSRQPCYHWSHDRGPETLALMLRLRPLMSPARQAQIDEAINKYQSIPHPGRGHWIRPRRAVAAVMVMALSFGCATAKDVFTNPTGEITIPRQSFVNSYALIKVLWKDIRHNAELACVRGPEEQVASCLVSLREIDQQAKALAFNIEAKIAVPESEIDWAVVLGLLKAIVSLVP